MEKGESSAPAATNEAVHYTRTGRISKAKKPLKVHNCECGRAYTRAEHLRRHQKNHAQDALRCDFPGCGRPFSRLDLLQRHQERHNEFGAESPHSVSATPYLPTPNSSISGAEALKCMQASIDPFIPEINHDRGYVGDLMEDPGLFKNGVTGFTRYDFKGLAKAHLSSPGTADLTTAYGYGWAPSHHAYNPSSLAPMAMAQRSEKQKQHLPYSEQPINGDYNGSQSQQFPTLPPLHFTGAQFPSPHGHGYNSNPQAPIIHTSASSAPSSNTTIPSISTQHPPLWPIQPSPYREQNKGELTNLRQEKHVTFEFFPSEASFHRRRLQIPVCIYPNDTTDSIIAKVKNYYNLNAHERFVFQDLPGRVVLPSYETLTDNMTIYVHTLESSVREDGSDSLQARMHLENDSNPDVCMVCEQPVDFTELLSCQSCKQICHDLCAVDTQPTRGDWYCKKCKGNSGHTESNLLQSDAHRAVASVSGLASDSDYHSGFGTDTESVCSMDSMAQSLGLPYDFLQEFVAFFGDTLIEKSGARQWAAYALAHQSQEDIEKKLYKVLKDYAVELASKLSSYRPPVGTNKASFPTLSKRDHQVLTGATALIRRYRFNIARYFCEHAVSKPVNSESLSVRLQSLGQQLSLTEKFGLLVRSGQDNVVSDDMESKLNAPLETAEDEDEAKLFMDVQPIRDLLVSGYVFDQTTFEIRQRLYKDDTHELRIIPTMWAPLYGSCRIELWWNPVDFMRFQYGDDFPSVGEVIVLTGSALYAQATTCKEYIKQTWPRSSLDIVQILDAVLKEPFSTPIDLDNSSDKFGSSISAVINSEKKTIITTDRYDYRTRIELAQQLAWLATALSRPPPGDQVVYARPNLCLTPFASKIIIKVDHIPVHFTERACWMPLFSGAVIASGFPIRERGEEVGLEVSLDLLAGLAGVQHAVEYQGGVVMKGFSHMFVPVRKTGDRIQWHAVSNAHPESHLTYHEGLSRCGTRAMWQDVSLREIKHCRAIVGWCSVAQSRLGSSLANYENIHYSTATDVESSTKCAGASLGFQQFGTAALDFRFGVKEGKCHFKRDGPYRSIVSWAENTPVVLYDTAERRGWLIPASDLMLHIIQKRHRLDPFEVDGKCITLDTTIPIDSTARQVLLKNMTVKLSNDKDHIFKTEIANIWSLLDFLIAQNVSREQNNSGATVKGTWCDILHGFEFNAVVDQLSPFRQKQVRLSNRSGGWPLLSQDIDAPVLLANGFEDLIVPAADAGNKDLCRSWRQVPQGNDYLATSTSMLRKLYNRAGYPLDRNYLSSTSKKLQWHQGSSILFGPCKRSNPTCCNCNRLQQIVTKPVVGTVIPPGSIENQGAVIFGHSGSMLQDILSKPRPKVPKFSGMYSQQNVQLAPIVIQDTEDASFSDGDNSGKSGSDFTLASTSGSLSSCTTLSSQDMTSQLHHPATIPVLLLPSLLKKRGRFPEVEIVSNIDDAETMEMEHKRLKSGQLSNFGQLSSFSIPPPVASFDCEPSDNMSEWHDPPRTPEPCEQRSRLRYLVP